jgi:hypothetical protein
MQHYGIVDPALLKIIQQRLVLNIQFSFFYLSLYRVIIKYGDGDGCAIVKTRFLLNNGVKLFKQSGCWFVKNYKRHSG